MYPLHVSRRLAWVHTTGTSTGVIYFSPGPLVHRDAEALVVLVIAGEVTVFDEAVTLFAAGEGDFLVLAHGAWSCCSC